LEESITSNNTNNNKTSYNGIYMFFIAVIVIFATINIYEFAFGIDDRDVQGLAKMSLLENQAVTTWGGLQKLLGKSEAYGSTEYGDVALMDNGYAFMPETGSDVSPMIDGMVGANELADEIDANFIYVQGPVKQLHREGYPEGVIDCSIEKYDAMIAALDKNEINYIDMRTVLESTDTEWFDYFYKSDHHWRNRAAFFAYKEICNKMLIDGISIDEELLNEEAYNIMEYKDVFLGSHGRMAGPWYTGLDDYELYLPKKASAYRVTVPSIDEIKEGTFEECFVHYENLEKYSYDYYAYYTYLKEDYELIEIENLDNTDGPSVVVVRDSSAVPVCSFLAGQCKEIDMIDLRYLESLDAVSYIREKNPDYIIYIFGTGYLGDPEASMLR